MELLDAYKSLIEAIKHAGLRVLVPRLKSATSTLRLMEQDGMGALEGVSAILVPGGFGNRGVEGKIRNRSLCP